MEFSYPVLEARSARTFIAGVELVRRGLAEPVGSLTQLGTIRLGKRFEHRSPKIKDFVPLSGLDDLVFGGWDLYEANCFEAALYARVLNRGHLDPVRDFLSGIVPMKAVFDRRFVKNLDGTYVKSAAGLRDRLDADQGRYCGFQEAKQPRPVRHDLVREYGSTHEAPWKSTGL